MNLKNYTSEVPSTTSMARIEDKLIAIGASNISKKYEDKICRGITFLVYDQRSQQTVAYHLKAQVDECYKIMMGEYAKPNLVNKAKVLDQSNRTAWKILFDWVDVQCAMILLGQAEPLQLFLPFMYDMKAEETFYDKIVSGKIPLQLNS